MDSMGRGIDGESKLVHVVLPARGSSHLKCLFLGNCTAKPDCIDCDETHSLETNLLPCPLCSLASGERPSAFDFGCNQTATGTTVW